jgi:uncharacterized protein
LDYLADVSSVGLPSWSGVISDALVNKFANNIIGAGYIDIEKQFKPELIKRYENLSSFNASKCNMVEDCPVYYRALFNLKPTLSIIGNVSKSTGILMLNGENDSITPVQQAFLLQQRLTELNHPDHTLITYPNLSFVSVGDSKWTNTAVCFSRYLLMV